MTHLRLMTHFRLLTHLRLMIHIRLMTHLRRASRDKGRYLAFPVFRLILKLTF
jgi:hypothetical protein